MAEVLAKANGYRLEVRARNEPYEFFEDIRQQDAADRAEEAHVLAVVEQAADKLFCDRMWALRAGGWRKYWRLLTDRELRNRAITLWIGRRSSTIRLAVIVKVFRADWFQLHNLWRRR